MADAKESTAWSDAGLSIFNTLWQWTGTSETWRVAIVVIIIVIVCFCVLTNFLKALAKVLEGAIKLVDAAKASGLPRFMKREERIKVRHRSQFCGVLEADLANIAKAESWNDQYFTDLEAEVETEGGYYISSLHRFFGRVSTGLRKEKSLIKAISTSSERAIQLTGEPGSGKSVALRHLASQMATSAKKSKGQHALVPLYINLREIVVLPDTPVTADTIRDFILDNIRRGDSDTTAYVRDNWTDYRERGIWFFLFDSFDEIPAVLHAEKGNPATKEYAEAIRKFLEGMGECRGILASREFKGPESLPWKKFRILRLTSSKQQDLVANAFLSQDQERAVLRHLATNESSLANTPLFLTLLCRYVKEESTTPKNDYELLSLQIDRLAQRDPSYLQKTYGLTPAQLLVGAQRIAQLFAEESSLGLAPTIDQVEAVLDKADIPGGDIQRFVAAMVDSKIARADVPNAAPGDRRFAFAHRRYQEALFVRHLVAQPGHLSGYELLTDPQWREYAVTLLETQPEEALRDMFDAAVQLLDTVIASQSREDASIPLKGFCGYFEWGSEATEMLSLLQEGLSRRVSVIPQLLAARVELFLATRWRTGDSLDRTQVMKVASLLPQETLGAYLEEAFASGSQKTQDEGFNQTVSLVGRIPTAVRNAVLKRLSDEILSAKDTSALLRVEALVARLPVELGANHVQRRCLVLWRLTNIISTGASAVSPAAMGRPLRALWNPLKHSKNAATFRTRSALLLGGMLVIYGPLFLYMALVRRHTPTEMNLRMEHLISIGPTAILSLIRTPTLADLTMTICTVVVCLFYLTFPIRYRFRAVGEKLTLGFFARRICHIKGIVETLKVAVGALLALCTAGGIAYVLGLLMTIVASHAFGIVHSIPLLVLGLGALIALTVLFTVVVASVAFRIERRFRRDFDVRLAKAPTAHLRLLLSASTWREFETWLSQWNISTQADARAREEDGHMRSLSAALEHARRGGVFPTDVAAFMRTAPSAQVLRNCTNTVEKITARFTTRRTLFASAAS
jgi:hypothetical protein